MEDTILSIDVKAVLKLIKELEDQLSEYHRQDKPPSWAAGLETRVSQLERTNTVIIEDAAPKDLDLISNDIPLEMIANEERLVKKLQTAMDSKVAAHHNTYESKVATYSLEVDRLHKLLAIRPTTSELQQVVNSVHETEKRCRDDIDQLTNVSMPNSVRSAVSDGMNTIVAELTTAKAANEETVKLVNKKIQDYAIDISNIRSSTQNYFDKTVDPKIVELTGFCSDNQASLNELTDNHNKEVARLNEAVNSAKHEHMKLDIELKEFQETTDFKFQETAKKLEEENAKLRTEIEHNMSLVEATDMKNFALESSIESLDKKFEDYRKATDKQLRNLNGEIREETKRREALQRLVDSIIGMKTDTLLADHEEKIITLTEQLKEAQSDINKNMEENRGEFAVVHQGIEEGTKDRKSLRSDVKNITAGIEKLFVEDASNKGRMEQLDERLKSMEGVLGSLLQLKPRLVTLETASATMREEMDALQRSLTRLIDDNTETARKTEMVDERVDQLEQQIGERMNHMRDTLTGVLMDVQNDMNKRLAQVRENIEAIVESNNSAKTDYNFPAVMEGGGGGYGDDDDQYFNKPKQNNNGPAMVHPDATVLHSSPESHHQTHQGLYQPPASVPVKKEIGGATVSGSGIPIGGHGKGPNAPRIQQKMSFIGDSSFNGPETRSLLQGSPSGGGGLIEKFGQYVQFICDLCINFEDIAVKKRRVLSVPPGMCESVAEVMQRVTEGVAGLADIEMVKYHLQSVGSNTSLPRDGNTYDESFVIDTRKNMIDDFLAAINGVVVAHNPQPGVVRLESRMIFLAMLKKSMDLFMSKHNQVLTVGNSRLGRTKVPSCIACDRPLVNKTQAEVTSPNSLDQHQFGLPGSSQLNRPKTTSGSSGVGGGGGKSNPILLKSAPVTPKGGIRPQALQRSSTVGVEGFHKMPPIHAS